MVPPVKGRLTTRAIVSLSFEFMGNSTIENFVVGLKPLADNGGGHHIEETTGYKDNYLCSLGYVKVNLRMDSIGIRKIPP